MLVLALLLTSSATTSDCISFSESFAVGREYRPGSRADNYAALRADDHCAGYWFDFHHDIVDLEGNGLEIRGATQVSLEFDVDPGVEVLVETARYRAGTWVHWPAGFGPRSDTLSLTRRSDYRRLCTGPCTVLVDEGRHYFALGHQGEVLAEVPEPLNLQSATRVEAELTSYTTVRTAAGWGLFAGLLSTVGSGAAVAVATVNDASPETRTGTHVALVSSLAVVAASTIALLVFRDDVRFEAEPLP